MRQADKKRLLAAWLEPKNKRRIFKLATRHAPTLRLEPDDVIQMAFEVVWKRPAFGPGDDVVWRAQDAIQNLVKNRKRSQEHKRLRFFSHKTTTPLDDYAENEWVDEAGEVFEDENLHAALAPSPERALLEKERVLTYRAFLDELKTSLDPVELAIVASGEADDYETTELQRTLRCPRATIYEARRSIKKKALKLRERWAAAGRELPGFGAPGEKENTDETDT
jgi:hypothetical protein